MRSALQKLRFVKDGVVTKLCYDYDTWWMEDEEGNVLPQEGHFFYARPENITGYLREMTGMLLQPIHKPRFALRN